MRDEYSISSEMRNGVEIFILQESGDARAEIAPSLGNNCFAFETSMPVLEPVAFEQFCEKPTSYGIPVLFPFPNRIRDGAFTFGGERYQVDPPRHGFVRDKEWKVLATGASESEGAWIRSGLDAEDYAEEILRQFPFPFSLEITYRLKDGRLELQAVARNTGEREMPIGFGTHPYFRRPERGTIRVPAAKRWELSDSLPTGRLLEVDGQYDLRRPRDIAGLTLDDIYTDPLADVAGRVQCLLADDVNQVQTVVDFDAQQFPNVVVYTPPAPRQAICIEPNSCPTDAFNLEQQGIRSNVIVLGPGETAEFSIQVFTRSIRQG
ncbi:MAG TPA: aldose 1-epimerase [Blastocatellia bacterium]|nr:aldose 1-epimerase [Blastocatellia bacterium]